MSTSSSTISHHRIGSFKFSAKSNISHNGSPSILNSKFPQCRPGSPKSSTRFSRVRSSMEYPHTLLVPLPDNATLSPTSACTSWQYSSRPSPSSSRPAATRTSSSTSCSRSWGGCLVLSVSHAFSLLLSPPPLHPSSRSRSLVLMRILMPASQMPGT